MSTNIDATRKKGGSIYGRRHVPSRLPSYTHLKFLELIGEGHFSHVYKGIYKDKFSVAIKLIERGDYDLINNEIDLLVKLRGCPNIIQLYEFIRDDYTILIFERIKSLDIEEMLEDITLEQVKFLVKSLLQALESAHSKNIIHRDVKLSNVLISQDFDEVKLIDWGCGCVIGPNMLTRAGSRTSRPPEMLLGDSNYGTGCDIWAVGVLILSILCKGTVPWKDRTGLGIIVHMTKYYGSDDFDRIQDRIGLDVPQEVEEEMFQDPIIKLESSFDPQMNRLFDPGLIGLMKCLLIIDPIDRPTATQALQNPFFL